MELSKFGKSAVVSLGLIFAIHPGKANAASRPADTISYTSSGLNYKYYEGNFTTLPDFSKLTPVKSDSCLNFDLSQVPHKATNYAVVFTGYLSVDYEEEFTFALKAKDGAQLLIGDSILINNDGLHATAKEDTAKISLMDGKHRITVRYFMTTGTPTLVASYASSISTNNKLQPIPDGALFRPFTGVVPKITVLTPAAGQTYKLADTISLKFVYAAGTGYTVLLSLSLDGGKSGQNMYPKAYPIDHDTVIFKWAIPDSAQYITNQAVISIGDYIVGRASGKSDVFKIVAKNAAINPLGKSFGSGLTFSGATFKYQAKDIKQVSTIKLSLINLKGESISLKAHASAANLSWTAPSNLSGLYMAVLTVNGAQEVRTLVKF